MVLLVLVSPSLATVKRWKGTMLSWDDSSKWLGRGGQLPCPADLVEFDETWVRLRRSIERVCALLILLLL